MSKATKKCWRVGEINYKSQSVATLLKISYKELIKICPDLCDPRSLDLCDPRSLDLCDPRSLDLCDP